MMLRFFLSFLMTLLLFGCVTPVANVKDYDIAIHNKALAVSTNGVIGAAWGQTSVHLAINNAIKGLLKRTGDYSKGQALKFFKFDWLAVLSRLKYLRFIR